MTTQTLYEFIKRNRAAIDKVIRDHCRNIGRLNDDDRRGWIVSDERLYLWARSRGARFTAVLLALVALGFASSERPKSLVKVSHLSPTQVGISCQNGADPTGYKVGETLIITCGH